MSGASAGVVGADLAVGLPGFYDTLSKTPLFIQFRCSQEFVGTVLHILQSLQVFLTSRGYPTYSHAQLGLPDVQRSCVTSTCKKNLRMVSNFD